MILARDFAESVSGPDGVISPVRPLIERDLRDAPLEDLRGSGGQMKIEGLVRRRGAAQQAGIQGGDFLHGRADKIGDEWEIDAVVGLHGVIDDRRIWREVIKAVLFGILRHDGDGEDDGNVVLGFSGEVVAFVELPEVGVAGALDGALHVGRTPVVRCHGEVPVAELLVEILHVLRVGDR